MTNAQRWAIYVGIGALALYVVTLVMPYPFLVIGNFRGDQPAGSFFLQLLATKDNTASFALGLLTPALSVVSVATLWSIRRGLWARVALVLCVVGVLAAWGLWFWLGRPDTSEDLWQPAPVAGLDTAERFSGALHEYLGGAWKGLATLGGVLLGSQLVK